MGIKEVLTDFWNKGINKNWFETSTIGELEDSCCIHSNIEVIDFDKAEIKHREDCGFGSLKSCDALKFMLEEERIDFIEMKSSKNVIKNSQIDTNEKLQEQINKFNLTTKLTDSLHILKNISHRKEFNFNKEKREIIENTPKQIILLTDLNFKDNTIDTITFTLDFLANMSTDIKKLLQNEINKIGEKNINNLLQPKLMNCEEIEDLYN